MFYLLHPGLVLIALALLIRIKKQWQNYISIVAPMLGILLLLVAFTSTASGMNLIFSTLDSTQFIMCISILIVLLANNIFTISKCKTNYTRDLQLSLIYVGSGIYIILSQNLVTIFLSLELMMIIGGGLIFNGNSKKSSVAGLGYIKIHLLSGMLFLLGILMNVISKQPLIISTISLDQITTVQLFILSGLLINIALPPFSYWLTEGYTAASPFGSVTLAVCMTKISVMLIAKMLPGAQMLIYLGVFMGFYGIVYMLVETNLRKIVTFAIISETGLILIAIGVGNLKVATSLIISNIFYVALLMMCASRLNILSKANHYFEIYKLPQKKIMLFVYIITLFSVTAFPLTPGYINKYNLNLTIASLENDWLLTVVNILNAGVIFALCFKTIDFIFIYKKPKAEKAHQSILISTYYNLELYILTLSSIIFCFLICFILDLPLIIDIKAFKQLLLFLFVAVLFFLSRKYLFFFKPTKLIELDFIYRGVLFLIYEKIKQILSIYIEYILHNRDKMNNVAHVIIVKLMGPQGAVSYSKYLSSIIILIVIMLIFFLIHT